MAGGGRPEGRHRRQLVPGHHQPPISNVRRRRPAPKVRKRRPLRRGHGGALRRPHHRQGPLLHVRLPPYRRRRPPLPALPAAALFWVVVEWDDGDGSLVVGSPRRGHAGGVRQPVLRQPFRRRGAASVGPGPGWRSRGGGRTREGLRRRRSAVLRGLRGLHGEDGEAGAASGQPRRGPQKLPCSQLLNSLSTIYSINHHKLIMMIN